ncbi:hypothetical protein KGM_209020 [Danaus plexippus plexippus]|uniref:PI3K/PI4K catalytic domain-containing protein n=1 Tax=Danaus plexippus plexippus TaxID=278856 RepID=A0A212EN71_DANPL|nr:hypothetical protein KGM_209020 [Danaus plexippus plexippus]
MLSICETISYQSSPSTDVVLDKLDSFDQILDENVSQSILNTLQPLLSTMDQYSVDQLLSKRELFSPHPALLEEVVLVESSDKYKQCLSLVADPVYLLKQYIRMMLVAVQTDDVTKYKQIYKNMRQRIFENPYVGADYIVLNKYSKQLEGCDDFGVGHSTDCWLSRTESTSLNSWKMYVSVYRDAVTRPVLLSYLSSDGFTRRCIVKTEGKGHAAAVRVRGALEKAWEIPRGYKVTPLTSDCLLIEYVENNTRLRDMVDTGGGDAGVTRTADENLILNVPQAISQLESLAKSVPSTSLRSTIESGCLTLEEFIGKKTAFTESLGHMTAFSFICGLSDRHLQNILYDPVRGTVCAVDCGALQPQEIPPARLTRNLLAVCRTDVLEARLQRMLSRLREYQGIILPAVNISLKRSGHLDKVSEPPVY